MEFEKLTMEQKAAVKETGSILVSAAAGSGKTAVLVERIIDELTRKENPLSADRLLVVTFTVAAAGEMRSRLEKGLSEYCRNHPFDTHASKQRLLLSGAKICTIDAFCIELLRENFEKADVDPDFKIAEESELLSASSAALARVMQRHFEENSDDFSALLDAFGCVYDERNLTDQIKEIYEKSQNLPFGEMWLLEAATHLGEEKFTFWLDSAFNSADETLSAVEKMLEEATEKAKTDETVLKAYGYSLTQGCDLLKKMRELCITKNWDALLFALQDFKFERFGSVKGAGENPVAVRVKSVRDYALTKIKEIGKLFFDTRENIEKGYMTVGKHTRTLLTLTREYSDELKNELKNRGILSFADVEQKALGLLCYSKNGEIYRNDDADEYISAFDEILVDEFQDVNDLQNILFEFLSDGGRNLFAVGDVKQSIYGFRGANPNNFLFRRKNAVDYTSALQNETKKIILGSNFRSAKDICDFTNFFFSLFMSEKNCGMQYEKEDYLVAKADIEQSTRPGVEVHLVEAEATLGEKVSEARHIADYIESVMSEQEAVYDKNTKSMRKAKYGDFAIILRKMKGDSTVIAAELKKRGIPVSYSKSEFLESREISVMISLLSVISNPTRDIDLLTVMASPIFAFTPEEIAKIRICNKDSSLYSAVLKSSAAGDKKATAFFEKLSDFRRLSVLYPLPKLISVLYEKTGFLNMVSMMSDGELRHANLTLLLSQAESFERTSKGGLEGFLVFLKSEDAQKIKPATLTASGDAVRIMSVHYSKGLQFPICILGFLSSAFNTADLKNSLIFDSEDGISFRYYGEDGKTDSLVRQLLSNKAKKKMLAEELRLFYVAVTRAENRLVMMLGGKNIAAMVEKAASKAEISGGNNSFDIYSSAISAGEWILSALLSHKDAITLREMSGYHCEVNEESGRLDFQVCYVEDVPIIKQEVSDISADKETEEELNKRFCYDYPFSKILSLESKASVSSLVHKKNGEEQKLMSVPMFMLGDELSAAGKGTATHKVMQFIDFFAAEKDLQSELERLKEWEFITDAEYNAVDTARIEAFIKSELFLRMKSSDTLEREMRFITTLPAGFLYEDADVSVKDEPIVVQGAMDCVFIEDGAVVIVDFKTDRVKEGLELKKRYARQLDIYAEACKKIFELPIKQKLIYSLYLDSQIEI